MLRLAQNPFRNRFCGESKAVSQVKSHTGRGSKLVFQKNDTPPRTYLERLHNARRQNRTGKSLLRKSTSTLGFFIKSQYETTSLGFVLRGNCKTWQKEVCVCVGGCCFVTHVMHSTAIPSLHWTIRAFGGGGGYNI